jgi:hypothetical protein
VVREHEFTAKVALAEIFEDGETAQSVIRGAARIGSGGANCPHRLKRGQEAKQEVLGRLV